MSRILCASLAALLVMILTCCALAEPLPDLSGMSLDQLYQLRAQVDEAISAREREAGAGFWEDGTYLVGEDLPEGDYALQERADAMFASVLIRAGNSPDDALIMHKLISGQGDIRLAKGTWVTFSEVRAWPLGAEPAWAGDDGTAGEGGYLVGVQLAGGRYLVVPDDKAPLSSYSVYSGIPGTGEQLTKFEVLKEQGELALAEGDYVELSGCALNPIE